MPAEPRAHRLRALGGLLLGAALAGCTITTTPTSTGPSASPTGRPFTVVVTGKIRTIDPAVATSEVDSMLVTNLYQRLMKLPSGGGGELKPDGPVFVKGTLWRGRSADGPIAAGTKVRVRGVDGLILRVEPEPPSGAGPDPQPSS